MRTRGFFIFTRATSLRKAGCITIVRSTISFTGVATKLRSDHLSPHLKRPIALRLVHDSCGFLRQRVIILALAQRLRVEHEASHEW